MMTKELKIDYMRKVLDSCKTMGQLNAAKNWIFSILEKMNKTKEIVEHEHISLVNSFSSLYVQKMTDILKDAGKWQNLYT